eukprot:1228081-Amphidinium_carterae.1
MPLAALCELPADFVPRELPVDGVLSDTETVLPADPPADVLAADADLLADPPADVLAADADLLAEPEA